MTDDAGSRGPKNTLGGVLSESWQADHPRTHFEHSITMAYDIWYLDSGRL